MYVSNESHVLHIFEYTKENNNKGMQFNIPAPSGGWRVHTWHSLVLPIADSVYSFPMSTPWDAMDERHAASDATRHGHRVPGSSRTPLQHL